MPSAFNVRSSTLGAAEVVVDDVDDVELVDVVEDEVVGCVVVVGDVGRGCNWSSDEPAKLHDDKRLTIDSDVTIPATLLRGLRRVMAVVNGT